MFLSMENQAPECCICGRLIGKGQKYDLNVREDAYYVGNFQLMLDLQERDGTKVCSRCYNRNRELNKRIQQNPDSSTSPLKKKKEDNRIRDRYFVDTTNIEELIQALLGCCKCGGKWTEGRPRGHGAILELEIYCEHGHNTIWSSSRAHVNELQQNQYVTNVALHTLFRSNLTLTFTAAGTTFKPRRGHASAHTSHTHIYVYTSIHTHPHTHTPAHNIQIKPIFSPEIGAVVTWTLPWTVSFVFLSGEMSLDWY